MILNYLKLGVRLLTRQKFFTFINVLGLSIGFAVFLILWQYSQSELHADQFHPDFDRILRYGSIYRFTDSKGNFKEGKLAINDPQMARSAREELGEIKDFTRVFVQPNFTTEHIPLHGKEIFLTYIDNANQKQSFAEKKVAYGDPNLFKFFNFPLLHGNADRVLNDAYAVAISESVAKKYFGSADAMDKTLLLNDKISLKVTGVFMDLPKNTHLSFDIVMSTIAIEKNISRVTLTNGGPYCYLKLDRGVDILSFEAKIKRFADERYNKLMKNTCPSCSSEAYIQPLIELPYNEGYWFDFSTPKSQYLLLALKAISVVILLMAWINNVNLAISANNKRIKELAARKTVGANAFDLVKQFISEALVINLIALAVGIAIVEVFRPIAVNILQFYIPDLWEVTLQTWLIVFATLTVGVLFTGIYPAAIAIRNSPKTLFGSFKSLRSATAFSKLLTTFQFTFAIVLIVWIFSISLQLEYILNKRTGFKKDEVIVLDLPFVRQQNFRSVLHSFTEELSRIPGIVDKAVSSTVPGVEAKYLALGRNGDFIAPQSNGGVDERFIPMYGITLLAGRNFLADNPADERSVIISKATAARMGWMTPDDAIGQQISIQTKEWTDGLASIMIIGVIEDYKLGSLFSSADNNPDGVALIYKNYLVEETIAPTNKVSLLVQSENIIESMGKVEGLYNRMFPGNVFSWNFLDQQINMAYNKEMTTRNQITFFTGLAILIACIGLLGMITNKVVEKTKEIGIRQVLGAETRQLASVLLKTTLSQIAVAILLGIPAAWLLIEKYLEKFSDRIPQQWWHYALPVIILICIMLSAIAYSILKAVKNSPVRSLRYE